MVDHHKRRVKFPQVLEYANAREALTVETDAHVTWAWRLVGHMCFGLVPRGYTPACVWHELRAHQAEMRAFLEAVLAGGPTPAQMELMTAHCNHVRHVSRDDAEPTYCVRDREFEYLDVVRTGGPHPALRRRMTAWARNVPGRPRDDAEPMHGVGGHASAADEGLADGAPPPEDEGPPEEAPSYGEILEPQDPLDPLYYQLRQFYHRGTIALIQKCPRCHAFFLPLDDRRQTYCQARCRQHGQPNARARNVLYQRKFRAKSIPDDLDRVANAKQRLRALGERELQEEWVLRMLPMDRRRWKTLVDWEVTYLGAPKVTDLTRVDVTPPRVRIIWGA
jgi:hypothetical protein